MATLYWHNLNADNDATERSNYSTDQAGTVAATAGSMAADDLRFDGTGTGAGDNWVIPVAGTVEASTIDFTNHPLLVGTEDLIIPANQSTIIATTITNLGAGRVSVPAAGLGGIMRANAVSFSLSMGRIGGASNRITIEYTGLTPKCSVSGSGNIIYARESSVLDDSTIEFESTASGEVQYRNGLMFAAPGGQLRKTGAGHLRHQGGRSGYANIGSVDIEAGELGIGTWDDNGDPTGFDPVDPTGVPITFSANTGLQLEASNNNIFWGLNLQIPALATGARVRFSGGPQTIASGSILNAQEDVTLEHPLNTRVALSPTFSGPGKLTLEYSGNGTSIYRIDTGSPISNQINVVTTGGTASRRLELSPGTEITAALGAGVLNGPVTLETGSKLTLAADATLSGLVTQGHLDLAGFALSLPSYGQEVGAGSLTPNGGTLSAANDIVLTNGTLADPVGATFNCANWLSEIDAVGSGVWFVNASVSAKHMAGTLAFSTATGEIGTINANATDGGNNTNWLVSGALAGFVLLPLGLGLGLGVCTGRNRPWNRPL